MATAAKILSYCILLNAPLASSYLFVCYLQQVQNVFNCRVGSLVLKILQALWGKQKEWKNERDTEVKRNGWV